MQKELEEKKRVSKEGGRYKKSKKEWRGKGEEGAVNTRDFRVRYLQSGWWML
jgi:hypothetical protein